MSTLAPTILTIAALICPKGNQIGCHFLIQLRQVTLGRDRGKLILQGVNHCLSIFVAEVSAEQMKQTQAIDQPRP